MLDAWADHSLEVRVDLGEQATEPVGQAVESMLDEPTSQMDARGEHAIFTEIKRLAAERMTIVVTHQLANTKLADRVLVMDQGRVIEHGTYGELVAANGRFAELVALAKDR